MHNFLGSFALVIALSIDFKNSAHLFLFTYKCMIIKKYEGFVQKPNMSPQPGWGIRLVKESQFGLE